MFKHVVDATHRIHAYFKKLGLPDEEATELHYRYYTEYGLAVRGLIKHHGMHPSKLIQMYYDIISNCCIDVDPLVYDKEVDQSIPLEKYLKPDPELREMLSSMKDVKKWAFTNAYKVVCVISNIVFHVILQPRAYAFLQKARPKSPPSPRHSRPIRRSHLLRLHPSLTNLQTPTLILPSSHGRSWYHGSVQMLFG